MFEEGLESVCIFDRTYPHCRKFTLGNPGLDRLEYYFLESRDGYNFTFVCYLWSVGSLDSYASLIFRYSEEQGIRCTLRYDWNGVGEDDHQRRTSE